MEHTNDGAHCAVCNTPKSLCLVSSLIADAARLDYLMRPISERGALALLSQHAEQSHHGEDDDSHMLCEAVRRVRDVLARRPPFYEGQRDDESQATMELE